MGKELDHSKSKREERVISEYSWDYCFPGDEMGYKWTVLVGKERKSGGFMATTVPMKGGSGKFAADKSLEFIEQSGDKDRDDLFAETPPLEAKRML